MHSRTRDDQEARPVLVAITGDGPGLGKSTLARRLHELLGAAGQHVELFAEHDVLSDPCFTHVAREFRETGEVGLEPLLDGARRFAAAVHERRSDVAVVDSLFPYLPSLFAWGHSDETISAFFSDLAEALAGTRLVQIHLTGDLGSALERAAAREGGDWLAGQVAKTDRYRGSSEVRSSQDMIEYLEESADRARRLLGSAPWRVESIAGFDGAVDPLQPANEALARVGVILRT
jgi:hypothetical protein